MCSSGRPAPSSSSSGAAGDNTQNSGSQYALCALGVGLVALGIVMIVWSVVPANVNNSSSGPGKPGQGGGVPSAKVHTTSSVAFVLAGVGVAMLLLSICLGLRSKRRQERREVQADSARISPGMEQEVETEEDTARYDVPTYEEAVGSGEYPTQYPVQPGGLHTSNSASQLPSYEDLVEDVRHGSQGPALPPTQPLPAANRQNGFGRKLRAPKVRRIKSEKLRLQSVDGPLPTGPLSIEPLTPPPRYEDEMPRL
ncbi:hypothetical protein GJAV_G00188340 [Gymnothorax javanicus]|nr:hypothetical protein GJAV_G00188340 [Gymnothorax javanicus]